MSYGTILKPTDMVTLISGYDEEDERHEPMTVEKALVELNRMNIGYYPDDIYIYAEFEEGYGFNNSKIIELLESGSQEITKLAVII